MDRRLLLGGGVVALLAAGAAFFAMAPRDVGEPVGSRGRERARVEAEALPEGELGRLDRREAPGATAGPAGLPAGEAGAADPDALVGVEAARAATRGLGVQLEGARVVLPDDDDGASAAVLDRAIDELSAVEAALAEGSLSPADATQRVLQIRLDAALGFDGAAEPADAKALKQALGFDMSEGDELGWGVPLTEANFGQIFGEDAGGVE